ncbi:hypothetical protein NDU88_001324 [Pleurodeles waltl]|uniref:Uncharacterized protein n=1 Tax=Pleurodeles waltl TaxID=8319 RepID=A0AAV7NDW0_PLEWA|nr:hypothetical protein NDU88_001324 [Pleurodeles waltl]
MRPVPRPRPPLAPLRCPARLRGRAQLSPRERCSPDPAAAEQQETPGGASRLPPNGPHATLLGRGGRALAGTS